MKYDIVIIGGGVMGAATAYHLSSSGKKVLILDQFDFDNERNASRDYSRAFRYEYGEDIFYTNLAVESLKMWKNFEEEIGVQLYFPCGALLLGRSENDYAMKSYETLRSLDHSVELLTRNELQKRFPAFSSEFGILDLNGGILEAHTATDAFLRIARARGVAMQANAKVIRLEGTNIYLESGEVLTADKIVLTPGMWVRSLLGNRLSIKTTLQPLIYLKPEKPGDFQKENFPPFAYLDEGFYGFPMHGIDAVKIARHVPGEAADPDAPLPDLSSVVSEARAFLGEFIPSLQNAELIKTKMCLYDVSPDKDFGIGELEPNLFVGTGFSGHGFKFAPLVGKYLADLALGVDAHIPERFELNKLL